MDEFFNKMATQHNPLRVLTDFLAQEKASEKAKKYADMRFVGYVLEIGYDQVTIITADRYKQDVGGVPRNSLLIMCPDEFGAFPPHFTLLRVLEAAPTPLSKDVQQTYFELHKKSMPELDVFTNMELQWGALKTGVLGMFYPEPGGRDAVEFSGDLNNYLSAHKYKVYAPTEQLLDLIVNTLVPEIGRFNLGQLRQTECRLPWPSKPAPDVPVFVSTEDFKGCRTAMFGKTRLGKSNVVKLLAESLIETTATTKNVGQLIFDINGEYANDNPQNVALKSVFPDRCVVYALKAKTATPSKPLKLNFYEHPRASLEVIKSLLQADNRLTSDYIKSFVNADVPEVEEAAAIADVGQKTRAVRKIQMLWAILFKANFAANEAVLRSLLPVAGKARGFDPGFNQQLRTAAYGTATPPTSIQSLSDLVGELSTISRFRRANPEHASLKSIDKDSEALLELLEPPPGRTGVGILASYRAYHDPAAGNFVVEILAALDKGLTVILDLGNAVPRIMKYFSDMLSTEVFNHQVNKFSNNALGTHFIQIYFEEAHNLFPSQNDDVDTIYNRFAKEGAKYQIGMVYSTQSPSTVSKDLLAQTENFFVAHLSSRDEVNALAKLNVTYESMREDILMAKTRGYIRMLTRSHRFVVSVQARHFEPKAAAVQQAAPGA